MKKIYVATHNQGKQKEIQAILKEYDLIFPTQEDAPEEPASTFVENALIKARHGCKISGLPTLADDAGVVIPALKGAPGVHSAYYSGKHGDAKSHIEKVLQEMEGIKNREVYFYCVVVLLQHVDDPTPLIAEGKWEGTLLTEARGNQGFGYDPIFLCPEKNCSAAELPPELKNTLSHRAKALAALRRKLSTH